MTDVHSNSKRFSVRSFAKSFSSSIKNQHHGQTQPHQQQQPQQQQPPPDDGTITPTNHSSTSSRNSLSGPSRYYNKSLIHQQIVDNEALAEANVKLEEFSPIGASTYGLSSLPTPPPTHLNGGGQQSVGASPLSANLTSSSIEDSSFDISEHIRMELFDEDAPNGTAGEYSESFYTSPQDGSGTSPSSSGNSPVSHHGDDYKKVWIAPGSMDLDHTNNFLGEDLIPGIFIPSDLKKDVEVGLQQRQLKQPQPAQPAPAPPPPTFTPVKTPLKSEPSSSVSTPKSTTLSPQSSHSSSSSEPKTRRKQNITTQNTSPTPTYFPDFNPDDWNDTSNLKYHLQIADLPNKSRVETQIKLVLNFFPPPPQKSLHLPSDTISKPKLQLKDPFQPSPETLHLETIVVCHSNLRRYANMCKGCIRRERKRASRKKVKLPVEEAHWCEDSEKRGIVFNCKELVDFGVLHDIDLNGKVVQSQQIELPMRLACYCRHHNEKIGFR